MPRASSVFSWSVVQGPRDTRVVSTPAASMNFSRAISRYRGRVCAMQSGRQKLATYTHSDGAPSFVFFVQLEPDIDHIAPIVWRLARDNAAEIRIVSTNVLWNITTDYRLKFLRKLPGVTVDYVHYLGIGGIFWFRAMEWLLRLPAAILRTIPINIWSWYYFNISAKVVCRDKAAAFFRAVQARCVIVDEAQPNSSTIYAAARDARVPVVTVQTANGVLMREQMHVRDPIENTDYMILPNRLADGYEDDPRIEVLGCMRYCGEWASINGALVSESFPAAELPRTDGKLNVLILGWIGKKFVRQHPTVEKVFALPFVDAVFKARPRTTTPRKLYEDGDDGYPTVRLIQWADVVVTSVTSVVLEAMYQKKPIIYVKYIAPEETATFERYGACWQVGSDGELEETLGAFHRSRPSSDAAKRGEVEHYLEDAVYTGQPATTDILTRYSDFLKCIAATSASAAG